MNNNGTVYLCGQRSDGTVALAQALAGSVTDQTQWTTTAPGRNDSDAAIPNAGAGGQGTFYFSS